MQLKQASLYLLLVLLLFLIVSGVFRIKVAHQITADQELISITFDNAIENELNHANNLFNRIISRPAVLEIMHDALDASEAEKSMLREELYQMLKEEYEYRSSTGNLKQLHFHTPDNHSFLRFHRPKKFGDDLTEVRKTIVYVNENLKPVVSFEEGRIFNGYRYVYPLFYNDKHIGSVETSVSLKAIMDTFRHYLKSPTSFLMKTSLVEQKVFKDELSNYKPSGISDNFVIEKSIQEAILDLTLKVHESSFMSHQEHEQKMSRGEFFSDHAHLGNLIVMNHYLPIFNDITKTHSGYLIVTREHSELGALFIRMVIVFFLSAAMILLWFIAYNHIKKTRRELHYQTELLDEIQHIANVGTWDFDFKTQQLYWSRKTYDILGVHPSVQPTLEIFYQRVHPEDELLCKQAYEEAIENKQDFTINHRVILQNGEIRYISEHGHFMLDETGEIDSVTGLTRDNSEHATLVEQLQQFINTQKELILLVSKAEIEFANQAFLDFFDVPDTQSLQNTIPSLNKQFLEFRGFFHSSTESNITWINEIDQLPQKERVVLMNDLNGIRHAFSITVSPLDTDKNIVAFHDITETISEIQKLTDRVQHDNLTHAYNRHYLESLMMRIAVSSKQSGYFLMMFDIDHFKKLNDKYGHLAGDSVLKQLANLVTNSIRDNDSLIRWGGEEFIIIGEISSLKVAAKIAEKLRQRIEVFPFEATDEGITCSFGVTTFKNNELLESIIGRADKLLYQAKEAHRNCVKSGAK